MRSWLAGAVVVCAACSLATHGLGGGRDGGTDPMDATASADSAHAGTDGTAAVEDRVLAVDGPTDAASCAEILERDPSAPDGDYIIVVGDERRDVYCDMTSDGGGWTRAIDLDPVTDGCPPRWDYDPMAMGCWIDRPDCSGEIRAFVVDVPVAEWTELRGWVRGYQFQTPDGFQQFATSIDRHYVDGVSFTTGSPRRHLWTLGVGLYQPTNPTANSCPCDNGLEPPPFVGDNWTCETGNDSPDFENLPIWYLDDPLWDGDAHVAGCGPAGDWFLARLDAPSEDPIEVRIMIDQCDDDLAITEMRLFVR